MLIVFFLAMKHPWWWGRSFDAYGFHLEPGTLNEASTQDRGGKLGP